MGEGVHENIHVYPGGGAVSGCTAAALCALPQVRLKSLGLLVVWQVMMAHSICSFVSVMWPLATLWVAWCKMETLSICDCCLFVLQAARHSLPSLIRMECCWSSGRKAGWSR